ncbi:oxidoreductase [Aliidongia dinghuensis]|uniref:Oxidoreductase n=1 Tax=Aliidongia dinghuensis TaxID=1867774 RepID=A0A8J3E439_9PROT|nr:aldo/keto reductase [Aliidongia dinghuensis]GGF35586.1 oxidoreductase [Aliidongia dinghuensis]
MVVDTKRIELAPGLSVRAIGQGTWHMGERAARKDDEVAALRLGLDLGLDLIDTAEMYGDGGAEQVVGEAIAGRRDQVTVVSKVYPHNATRRGTIAACERSLRRLGTDRIDVYLLHWRGSVPLAETVEAMEALVAAGKIRHYGVSNFDAGDMAEWVAAGGRAATNQVLYNLGRRGVEWDLLPWCRAQGVSVMAYSPIEQGDLAANRELHRLADELGVSAAMLALAWVLRQGNVAAIPKAVRPEHVRQNRAALDLEIEPAALAALDRLFPAPRGPEPLAMI